jgi:hypothetical protein
MGYNYYKCIFRAWNEVKGVAKKIANTMLTNIYIPPRYKTTFKMEANNLIKVVRFEYLFD